MGYINTAEKTKNNLTAAVKILAFLNMLLACAALMKDIFSAAYLGTTGEADALILAFSVPDILGSSLFAAAIGTSCIPVFSSLHLKEDSEEFKRGVLVTTAYILVCSFILFLLLYIFRNTIIGFLGRGFSEDIYALCIKLFIIILPIFIMYPAAAVGASAMQVSGEFIAPAIAPIAFNIFYFLPLFLGYILNIPILTGTFLTGFSITAGVLAMLLITWYPLCRYRLRISLSAMIEYLRSGVNDSQILKRMFRIFAPYLFILLFTQGVLYVERYIASGLGEGSISGLNYAYRISQFPVWVFVSAIGTVIYPSIARLIMGDDNRLSHLIRKTFNIVILVTIPMSIFLAVLRVPVMKVLFMRGAFNQNSLEVTSDILLGYCLAIFGQSIAIISLKILLAAEDIKKALRAYIISFIINVFLDFYLTPIMGIKALGYGAAAGAMLSGILTYGAVRKKYSIRLNLKTKTLLITSAANISVILFSELSLNIWYGFADDKGFILQLCFLLVSGTICAIIYGLVIRKAGLIDGRGIH